MAIQGFGNLHARSIPGSRLTEQLNSGLLFPGLFAEFSLTGNTNLREAKALVGFQQITAASFQDDQSFDLNLRYEFVDWAAFQFAFGERAATVPNTTVVPVLKIAEIVDLGGGEYGFVDPELTAVNTADRTVGLYIAQGNDSVDANFYEIDGTDITLDVPGNRITFPIEFLGLSVQYSINAPVGGATDIEAIGVTNRLNAVNYDRLQFIGDIRTTNGETLRLHFPDVSRISVPSITTGDIVSLDVNYRANVPNDGVGSGVPYRVYNITNAV